MESNEIRLTIVAEVEGTEFEVSTWSSDGSYPPCDITLLHEEGEDREAIIKKAFYTFADGRIEEVDLGQVRG